MPDRTDDPGFPADDPRSWLDQHVPVVESVVSRVSARHRLPWQDRQDLLSLTWTHLVRDDYRVLRQFRGAGAVAAYLRVVVERQALDMRTRLWGKRRRRRFVGMEEAASLPSPAPDPLATLMEARRARHQAWVPRQLGIALTGLSADDRHLLHLRHARGVKVARMAAATGADQKGLYRHFDRLYAGLRSTLTGVGVSGADAREVTTDTT